MTSLTDAFSGLPALAPLATRIDAGDTAWLLAASALVLLMAPGLALFYGGMVRSKSVLNMIMMTFGALAAITVIWVLVGYSMAFGDDVGGGLLGNPSQDFGLQALLRSSADSSTYSWMWPARNTAAITSAATNMARKRRRSSRRNARSASAAGMLDPHKMNERIPLSSSFGFSTPAGGQGWLLARR